MSVVPRIVACEMQHDPVHEANLGFSWGKKCDANCRHGSIGMPSNAVLHRRAPCELKN